MYYGHKSLIDILSANMFSYPVGCNFTFLVVSLSVQMFLILMKLNLFIHFFLLLSVHSVFYLRRYCLPKDTKIYLCFHLKFL